MLLRSEVPVVEPGCEMAGTWETAPPWASEEIPLSPRQVEVLECYARGLDSLETAKELGISTSTVKNHVTQIFDKLGLERRCRIAALIKAWRRGEIEGVMEVDCGSGYEEMPDDDQRGG